MNNFNATGWIDSKEMKEIRALAYSRYSIPNDFFEGPVDFNALKEQIRDLREAEFRLNELQKDLGQITRLMNKVCR